MYYIAQKLNRHLILSNVVNKHYENKHRNLCDFFKFPDTISCRSEQPRRSNCINKFSIVLRKVNRREICYSGNVSLNKIDKARQYVMESVSLPQIPLQFNPSKSINYETFKRTLGVNSSTVFTVVHWRRGDQLFTRCKMQTDESINCKDANSLIKQVTAISNDSVIYVATNEPRDSEELKILHKHGFHTFYSVASKMSVFYSQPQNSANLSHYHKFEVDSFEMLAIESLLMLDATTFLGWGISEVNDVIEYERMKANKTHCLDQVRADSMDAMTWCALQDATLIGKGVRFQTHLVQLVDEVLG
jgi:hypothetical protein